MRRINDKSKLTKKEGKKWIKALHSGNYAQGQGQLCDISNSGAFYCCLGVLAEELYGEDIWLESDCLGDSGVERCKELLSGDVLYYKSQYTLIELNDDKGLSLKEIAVFIEDAIIPTLKS